MKQNFANLRACSILRGTGGSSADQPGSEWENTLMLTPSKPGRATNVGGDKTIVLGFFQDWTIDCVALIEAHSNRFDFFQTSILLERLMNFRIRSYQGTTTTTRLDWNALLSSTDIYNWGSNFFIRFDAGFNCSRLLIDFQLQSGNNDPWPLSVGAIIAGQLYTMPASFMAPLGRGLQSAAIVAGRPNGPVVFRPQEKTVRSWQGRMRFTSETQRLELERYLVGSRFGSASPQAIFPRLDLPTAFVSQEMWASANSDYASCAFGRFVGVGQQTVVGGGSYVDLVFEESG